ISTLQALNGLLRSSPLFYKCAVSLSRTITRSFHSFSVSSTTLPGRDSNSMPGLMDSGRRSHHFTIADTTQRPKKTGGAMRLAHILRNCHQVQDTKTRTCLGVLHSTLVSLPARADGRRDDSSSSVVF